MASLTGVVDGAIPRRGAGSGEVDTDRVSGRVDREVEWHQCLRSWSTGHGAVAMEPGSVARAHEQSAIDSRDPAAEVRAGRGQDGKWRIRSAADDDAVGHRDAVVAEVGGDVNPAWSAAALPSVHHRGHDAPHRYARHGHQPPGNQASPRECDGSAGDRRHPGRSGRGGRHGTLCPRHLGTIAAKAFHRRRSWWRAVAQPQEVRGARHRARPSMRAVRASPRATTCSDGCRRAVR